jgi:hypothetical protein
MTRRNPHEGRLAEVYQRGHDGLRWIGYSAVPIDGAEWSSELQGWIINEVAAKTSAAAA